MSDAKPLAVFLSWKRTDLTWKALPQDQLLDLRTSNPEYNRTSDPAPQQHTLTHYAPRVFGPRIADALMRLLALPDLRVFLASQNLKVYQMELDAMVLTKLRLTGHETLRLFREQGLDHVADRLDQFTRALLSVNPHTIPDTQAWRQWVDGLGLFPSSWPQNLEFDKFLALLGLSPEQADVWTRVPAGGTSLCHRFLRWHIKAFTAFGFATSLADVVAAIMAILNCEATFQPTEDQLVDLVQTLGERLRSRQWQGLWTPEIHGLDGEKDDRMALGLFQYLRYQQGLAPVQILWQFPPEFEAYARAWQWSSNQKVVIDPGAKNALVLGQQLL